MAYQATTCGSRVVGAGPGVLGPMGSGLSMRRAKLRHEP